MSVRFQEHLRIYLHGSMILNLHVYVQTDARFSLPFCIAFRSSVAGLGVGKWSSLMLYLFKILLRIAFVTVSLTSFVLFYIPTLSSRKEMVPS